MIKHFYEKIPGWFDDDFRNVYKEAVERTTGGATFVEVGSWLGKSTAFMAVELINSKRFFNFYAVDHWLGSKGQQYRREIDGHEHSVFARFMANMFDNRVDDVVWPLRCDSTMAASAFRDASVDFVFLDASHDFESVRKDVAAWLPKVKEGGVLAGHDVKCPGLMNAVHEFIAPGVIALQGTCWLYAKRAPTAIEREDRLARITFAENLAKRSLPMTVGRFDLTMQHLWADDFIYRAHLFGGIPRCRVENTAHRADESSWARYVAKWGGPPNEETFVVPYNTTTNDW